MVEFSVWDISRNLLFAARWTLVLSAIAMLGGATVAFTLLVLRLVNYGLINKAIIIFVELFQGTPLLMQLFLCYFGLALIGVETSVWLSASFALILYTAAYLCEIWMGCVRSVPKGQWFAGQSLGLTFTQQLKFIVFPQVYRLAVAPTVGFLVQVIKATALTSVIGFVELTKAGTMISNVTFKPFLVFSFVALIYFMICFPLSWFATSLELRFARAVR
jgi:polar amino acid transport system permease protein